MGKTKKISKQSNPFADRGLDKFSQVMAEVTAKRKEIADQIGASASDVRLTTSKGCSGEWTPVYPSSVVHSSGSSSDKSASASPRGSALSTSRATTEIEEKSSNLDLEKPKSSEAIAAFNSRQLLARLGFSLSLLGVFGVIYATGSALLAQIFTAIFVFLISFYILQVRSKTASLWIRRIFRSMRQFSRLSFSGLHFQDRNQQKDSNAIGLSSNASGQNPFSSSQPERSAEASSPSSISNKPSMPFPSAASVSNGSIIKTHIHEISSPAMERSIAMVQKPRVNHPRRGSQHDRFGENQLVPGKTTQDEAHSKIDSASSRPKDSVRVAISKRPKSIEIKSSPFKCSRATRNGPKQDIRYGILMMLTIALAGLAFGTIPGILGTTISWYIIAIFEELIIAKDQGSANAATLNRKESFKTKKVDQFSSIQKKKQPQKI